ncbi:LysM and putative peptidoglycan-binding domain-containing protein 4 [Varanus komodoensis]|uniref:LysM and putative peptidoglycan-binding domain-containing protein 4 n=1 Tax=Varanus komodoensis TaxID=61221 RepID=A0A8D2LVV4_VARKO|nr:lysM and putative peptidoglycan-binding domain-containing protein 4 [Varanus komodoensis]KAF7239552.1 LysM and putative peptidoglycan-binding domain-containing protein 4 [Varanus komodoensis]
MRLNKGLMRSFQAPATVQKFPSSQVFLFRSRQSGSDESSEEELEVMELRARKSEQQPCDVTRERVGDVVFLEREVKEDDSLNKLALQYGCKVADIKQVNNFFQEQDMYALKAIKIPVKVNGLLTEIGGTVPAPQCTGLLPDELSESSDRDNQCADHERISRYFRGIDQNIEQVASVDACPSTDYCIETPLWSPSGQKEVSSGVDCGIQWWNAVLVMLLIGVILPVFYIVYFKTRGLEVVANLSNTTGAANNLLRGLVKGSPDHLAQAEHTPQTVAFLRSGG